jgi:hypothetical protein
LLHADKPRIAEVLSNLLSNAIKFTTGFRFVTACHKSQFGCGDGPITYPPGESAIDCHVLIVGLPPGLPPCNGPHYSHMLVNCPVITSEGGKGTGTTCAAGNCTSGLTLPTKIDCTKNPNDPSCQQQQHHTAAYLQALNSGSPNPYKHETKDYEHYQGGLAARQQNSGVVPGIVIPSGTTSGNNNNPSTTKKCPDGSIIPAKDKCPTLTQLPLVHLLHLVQVIVCQHHQDLIVVEKPVVVDQVIVAAVVEAEAEEAVAAVLVLALALAQIQVLGHTITKPTYHIDRSK